MPSIYPTRAEESAATERRVEQLRTITTMLIVECRCLRSETAEAIARDLLDNEERWQDVEKVPMPRSALDAVVFGRDCLGFVHNATHLLGAKDPMWVEKWTRILI